MKKLISAAFIGFSVFASAQISLAGKANVLIPTSSASWKNFKTAATNAVEQKGKNITGFNVGLSLKIDLPTALYLMPEIYYTNFSNEVTVQNDANSEQTTIKAKKQQSRYSCFGWGKCFGRSSKRLCRSCWKLQLSEE